MLVYGFLLFVTLTCLLLLMQALWGREIYNHYRGSRAVTCPETHRQVAVSFDAFHAALTGLRGKCNLRLAECTLWPARIRCGQECIPAARRTAAYTQGQVEVRKTKKIYHVPVLLAFYNGSDGYGLQQSGVDRRARGVEPRGQDRGVYQRLL